MKNNKTIFAFITFFLLATSSAWASSAHGEGNELWMAYVYKCINFVVLVLLLLWAVRKPAAEYFRTRSLAIRESIEGSRRVFEEASENNRLIRTKMDNIENESREIHAQYIDSAQAESTKVLDEAVKTSQKIRDDVKKVADLELKKARQELREMAITLAKELAEKGIRAELNEADSKNLYQSYVTRMKEINS